MGGGGLEEDRAHVNHHTWKFSSRRANAQTHPWAHTHEAGSHPRPSVIRPHCVPAFHCHGDKYVM